MPGAGAQSWALTLAFRGIPCLPLLLHSLSQSRNPAETLPDPRLSLLEPAPVACPSEPCPHSALLGRRPTDCRRQGRDHWGPWGGLLLWLLTQYPRSSPSLSRVYMTLTEPQHHSRQSQAAPLLPWNPRGVLAGLRKPVTALVSAAPLLSSALRPP